MALLGYHYGFGGAVAITVELADVPGPIRTNDVPGDAVDDDIPLGSKLAGRVVGSGDGRGRGACPPAEQKRVVSSPQS